MAQKSFRKRKWVSVPADLQGHSNGHTVKIFAVKEDRHVEQWGV